MQSVVYFFFASWNCKCALKYAAFEPAIKRLNRRLPRLYTIHKSSTHPQSLVCRRHVGLGLCDALQSVNSWSSGSFPHPSHGTAYTRPPNEMRSPPRRETASPQHNTYRHTLVKSGARYVCRLHSSYRRVKREIVN